MRYPSGAQCRVSRTALALLSSWVIASRAGAAGFVDEMARRFEQSDFVFNRASSDIPFVPLGWVEISTYQESRLASPSGESSDVSFRQTNISEATLVPFLVNRRDALMVGQWMSWTQLDVSSARDTSVFSVAVPLGWARQSTPDWQLAAFVAPLAHVNGGTWYWDYMGGIFARYLHSDRFVWLFGLYIDIAPPEDFYVPYVGVTWTVNEHWTVSAVMPWPAVLYSPNPDWLVRLGVAPSSASWFGDVDEPAGVPKHPRIDFSAWDFGLRVEKREWNNLWLGAEVGVSGLRGFSFAGSDWQGPNSELGTSGYLSLTLNFRPTVPAAAK